MEKSRNKFVLLLAALAASRLHNADAHSVMPAAASHSILQSQQEGIKEGGEGNNFIQIKREDFLASARQDALQDLQNAFAMAPQEITLDLSNSSKFSKAFKDYAGTGICSAWQDLKSGKISSGLSENKLLQYLRERIPSKDVDIEDLAEAIKEGDVKEMVTTLLEGLFSPLPLTCIGIGFFFFLLWLLFLVWQNCIGKCRKACFCIPSKPRNVSFFTAVIVIVVGGLLSAGAGFLITYGQVGMQQSVGAMGSASCAAFNLIYQAEWGDEGNSKWNDEDAVRPRRHVHGLGGRNEEASSFAGIRELVTTLNGVKGLCTQQSPTNILQLLKEHLRHTAALVPLHELRVASNALTSNIKTTKRKTEEVFAKSYMVEVYEKVGGDFYSPFVEAMDNYKEAIDGAVNTVQLPDINIGTPAELTQLQSGLNKLEGISAEITSEATPVASFIPLVLWSEILFMLSGLLFACFALVLFFLTKGKRSVCLTALAWNWLLITVSLSLLTTAALFWASSLGTPVCDAGTKALLPTVVEGGEKDSFDRRFGREAPSQEPEHIILKCLQEEDYNLFRATGLSQRVQEGISQLQGVKQKLMGLIPSDVNAELTKNLEFLQQATFGLGRVVVYDLARLNSNPATKPLLDTFPEVLHSGIELRQRRIKLPGGQEETVYGMQDVNRVIYPAVLQYTGYDVASLMVTANYPVKNEAKFTQWLAARRAERKKELISEGKSDAEAENEAADYIRKLENALLLLKYKIQLLENDTICYDPSGSGGHVVEVVCTGMELFGRGTNFRDNLVEQSMTRLTIASREALGVINTQIESQRSYLEEMFNLISELASSIENSTSCSFVHKGVTEVAYLGCNMGVDYTWSSAFVRLVGQILAILLALMLFILWRVQKDNRYYEKKKKEEEEKRKKDRKKKEKDGDEEESVFTEGGSGRAKKTDEEEREQLITDSSMWA